MTDALNHKRAVALNLVSRRTFFAGAGVLALGSTFFALRETQLLAPNASLAELLQTLQRSTFMRHLNDSFRLSVADGTQQMTLRLTAVRDLTNIITFATEEQTRTYLEASFSLLFRGPLGQLLQQDSYTINHHRIGTFSLFVVPSAADEQGQYYEAVFNRLPE